MRRLLGGFLLLVPPATFVILYALIYLASNIPVFFWIRANGNAAGVMPPGITSARRLLLMAGLIAYGAYRAFAFHPYFRAGYRRWLETTPWDWRRPLPVGPARPSWGDIIIVGALSLPGWWFGDLEPLACFCLPMGAYLVALSLSFPSTGAWGFHIPVIFCVGLAVRLWDAPGWTYTSAILLAWAFAMVGIGRSFKRWPWTAWMPEADPQKLELMVSNPQSALNVLGWPFDRLGPRRDLPTTWRNMVDGFFACVLTAWWFYCLLGLAPVAGRGPISIMVIMYAILFTLIHRVTRYMIGYAAPLSLGARIALFRPILPSYDQVFLSPIAALFAITTGPWMLHKVGLEWDASAAIALGLAECALYLGGPDLRRWQLTASHRVVPAMNQSSKAKGGFIQVG